EKVQHLTRISSNAGIEYINRPVSDADGIIYCPMGMHHGELWSFDPKTKEKKQLLPKNLQTYGVPSIWRAEDGKVYGKKGNTVFLCAADGITTGQTQQSRKENNPALNGKTVLHIDDKDRKSTRLNSSHV